ncbi:MAG: hypothetical protein RQ966_03540 [Acetobacteraceae bacterium]|nr:hypothetical protein [Acetobacteraceae bacterium]
MSGSYTNTSGGSDTYNAGAAHDSGFYDPTKHDNQIVAVFEDQAAARAARDKLVDAGVPDGQVQVVAEVAGDAAKGASEAEDRAVGDQILSAFMSLFTHDDHKDFTHAVNQGHAMIVVTPTGDTDRHRVIQILEQSHPIDFDAKLEEWRQAGYDNTGAPRSPRQEMERRVGQREPAVPGSSRVRSYVAERQPATPGAQATGNTTAGAQTTSPLATGNNSPNG